MIWLMFGGIIAALGYFIGGLLLCVTVIGIPFGFQCFKIGAFVLRPFGLHAVSTGTSMGCLLLLLNILWICTGRLAAAISHLTFGCILCLTIIGIPFGLQHFKLIEVSLVPSGKQIIQK
ncbi:YccF domain-containing protein [Segetibacter aerophilus]|uniref:YccF domain-containing protein n=1 Tax=Segetibacter aerophilus TaxID=670293 RepID=UPI0021CE7597|nr:YccF domain-containing protein [Segetibacter aerophilus]